MVISLADWIRKSCRLCYLQTLVRTPPQLQNTIYAGEQLCRPFQQGCVSLLWHQLCWRSIATNPWGVTVFGVKCEWTWWLVCCLRAAHEYLERACWVLLHYSSAGCPYWERPAVNPGGASPVLHLQNTWTNTYISCLSIFLWNREWACLLHAALFHNESDCQTPKRTKTISLFYEQWS